MTRLCCLVMLKKGNEKKLLVNGKTWQQWQQVSTSVIVSFSIIGEWHKSSQINKKNKQWKAIRTSLCSPCRSYLTKSLQLVHLAGLHSVSQFLYWMANRLSVLVRDVDLLHYSQQLPERGRTSQKSPDLESFDQNISAFTAGLLETLLSPSITLTELLFEQHDGKRV